MTACGAGPVSRVPPRAAARRDSWGGAQSRVRDGPGTDRLSRSCHPRGFFRKFSAERARVPTGVFGEGLETQRHRLSHRGRCRKSHLPGTAATGPVSLHGDRGAAQCGVPGPAGGLPVWKDAPRNAVLAPPSSPLELVWDTSAHRKSVRKKLALRAASDHNPTARPVKWELANGSGLHVRGLSPRAPVSLSVDRVGRQWTTDLSPQP